MLQCTSIQYNNNKKKEKEITKLLVLLCSNHYWIYLGTTEQTKLSSSLKQSSTITNTSLPMEYKYFIIFKLTNTVMTTNTTTKISDKIYTRLSYSII
jgi:hypothetical protein